MQHVVRLALLAFLWLGAPAFAADPTGTNTSGTGNSTQEGNSVIPCTQGTGANGFPAGTNTCVATTTPAAYTGPGDVVSGATAWYGLRGYNAAYATGSNNAINIRRASDNTTMNIVILANGKLDIATANAFAGTDATCSGSTTGLSTTIAFTSCSSTPTALDTVSGAGFTQPAYLISCGSFVAGAGSCTLNVAQNIAVAETVTMQVAMFVTEAYDQTGNGHNVTQGTAANQPDLHPSGGPGGVSPGIIPMSSAQLLTATLTSVPQPFTFSAVATNNSAASRYFPISATGSNNIGMGWSFSNTAVVTFVSGTGPTVNVTSGTWLAMNGIANGASAYMNVNGTTSSAVSTGANGTNGTIHFVENSNTVAAGQGQTEGGIWPSAFSAANATAICRNQQAVYGATNFGAAC